MMSPVICLNCGADIEPFSPIHDGALSIPNPRTVRWKGSTIRLTVNQRIMVIALVRAAGEVMPHIALAEATGSDECKRPRNLIDVQWCRIRAAFHAVDPAFDRIETAWIGGARWRVEP